MNDTSKIVLGLAVSMALMAVDTVLLLCTPLSLVGFIAILIVALAVIPVSILTIKGEWVELMDDRISIKAPMAKLEIPFSSITELEIVSGFKPGLRVYGYGGLKRGSGDFTNEMLGNYTFAGTTAVDKMIVVRYVAKNSKARTVAFNLPDLAATEEMYAGIREATSCGSIRRSSPAEAKRARKNYRSTVRIVAGFTVIVLAAVAVLIAVAMTTGHVDVTLNDDSVTVDATMMHRTVDFDDIVALELRDGMDYGSRVGGLGNSNYLTGSFKNSEFGIYDLAVHAKVDRCIVLYMEGKNMVFNLDSDEKTAAFFDDLRNAISDHRSSGTAMAWVPMTA